MLPSPTLRSTTSTNFDPPSNHLQPQNPTPAADNYALLNMNNGASTSGSRIETAEEVEARERIQLAKPEDEMVVEGDPDRAVKYASSNPISRVKY
jgi:hypothetical protein